MTYRVLYSKISKAITNLSTSVDHEEAFAVQDDAATLNSLVTEVKDKIRLSNKVVSFKDYPYKDKCLAMLDEANFYLAEANDFLNS